MCVYVFVLFHINMILSLFHLPICNDFVILILFGDASTSHMFIRFRYAHTHTRACV